MLTFFSRLRPRGGQWQPSILRPSRTTTQHRPLSSHHPSISLAGILSSSPAHECTESKSWSSSPIYPHPSSRSSTPTRVSSSSPPSPNLSPPSSSSEPRSSIFPISFLPSFASLSSSVSLSTPPCPPPSVPRSRIHITPPTSRSCRRAFSSSPSSDHAM